LGRGIQEKLRRYILLKESRSTKDLTAKEKIAMGLAIRQTWHNLLGSVKRESELSQSFIFERKHQITLVKEIEKEKV